MPTYFGLASAFAHASISDQRGLVANQATASRLPLLVCERCGCAPDLVRERLNGFAFDPFGIEQLVGVMGQVAGMADEDRATMGSKSQRIVSSWGADRFADGLVKSVEAAIKRPRRSPSYLDNLLLEGPM